MTLHIGPGEDGALDRLRIGAETRALDLLHELEAALRFLPENALPAARRIVAEIRCDRAAAPLNEAAE